MELWIASQIFRLKTLSKLSLQVLRREEKDNWVIKMSQG